MAYFSHSSVIPHPPEEVFAWHCRPGAFERLVPPGQHLLPGRSEGIADGARNEFQVGIGLLRWRWVAEHDGYVEGRRFRDVEISGPLPAWVHTHSFEDAPRGCLLVDEVEYTAPFGAVGAALTSAANQRFLGPMFEFRHARTRFDLDRHARWSGSSLRGVRGGSSASTTDVGTIAAGALSAGLRVGVTGSSGFLARALHPFLTSAGHEVAPLPRRPAADDLESLDAVVHLAGEPIFGMWTPAKRERVRSSRVDGTRHLVDVMSTMPSPPAVLLSASGIAVHGTGYMAALARDWEAAALRARQFGTRVVTMRFGPVAGAGGGLLGPMLPAFRLGLGATIGSREASLSWIGLDDVVGAVEHLLRSDVEGPVDVVAPEVVSQDEFARTLGRVLGRPVLLRVPAGVLNRLAGDLGRSVTESIAVEPVVLEASGFDWITPSLESALRWELHGQPPAFAR